MKQRLADLAGPTPYTGETPERQDFNDLEDKSMGMPDVRPDYTVAPDRPAEEFNWSMSGTHVQVSEDDHNAQFQALEWNNFDRPHAYGKLELFYNWTANWHVYYTNMSHPLVEKRLRKYTRDQGWDWGGLLDEEGMPPTLRSLRQASVPGIGEINPGLKNWHRDEWSGMEMYDNPVDPEVDYYGEQDYPDEASSAGVYTCSECGAPCSDHNDLRLHIMREHVNPTRKPPKDPQPVVDLDDALPAGFNEAIMDQTRNRMARIAHLHTAASPVTPAIRGPVPFIYDIESDRIYVGYPGERHSDIQGRFTPGGIVEGMYDPRGNVQIRTETDMPYTVRHMAELWYALHPELEIKAIFLMQGQKKYRLASSNIGHQVRNLVATDPAAWSAYQALEPLGSVYAVGGVVRDVVRGKTPKDIDLMVQGVAPDEVADALEQLPGRVDLTGEHFGVFRYRDPEGNEVEVALPRTERSTGPGHRDFEVYTDPFITVGEDLARRDFTSNAMAVNLSTGELVDPYRGAEAIKAGVLEPVSDRAFVEDPLRILRAFSSVSRHGLVPSDAAYHGLAEHAPSLRELPQERLQMELDKIIGGDDPARAIELMGDTGVLQHVLPDVAATLGFNQQNAHHNYTLDKHLRMVLDNAVMLTDDLDVRWAALLHDIGKPSSQWIGEDGIAHYYQNKEGQGQNHEEVGAEMARKLLTDLKFPTDRIERICHLIKNHMFPTFQTQGGARKFLNKVGDEHADDLLTLRQADIGGKGNHDLGYVPIMKQYVQAVRDAGEATDRSQLAINGNDLIQMGMKPGPELGAVLEFLTQKVLEDPTLNQRETLLQLAQQVGDVKFSAEKTRQANILDPIHDELDPSVFNHPDRIDPDVKPKIIEWCKKKVYSVMMQAGWPDPSKYLELFLTGSLTTYQYSPDSDFDMSLWIDVERFPEFARADLIRLMIENCDGTIVPGTTHPIQCFVVDPVRFSKDDLYKPGLRSAYDMENQRWFVLPEKDRVIDVAKKWPEHIRYAQMCVDKLKLMLRYHNDGAVKIYWDFLHRQRFLDMRAGKGDYSLSNIVYKMIANEGLHPYIEEATGEHIA